MSSRKHERDMGFLVLVFVDSITRFSLLSIENDVNWKISPISLWFHCFP